MTATQPTPETQAATADAPAAAVAPQAPAPQPAAPQNPSDPIVEVGGSIYHLRGLSITDANRMYDALPPEYQRLADHYALVAKAYETALHINLPPGVTPSQALRELLNAPRTAEGLLDQAILASKPYLGELQTQLGRNAPGAVTGMLNDITGTAAFIDGLGAPLDAALNLPGRVLNAGGTIVDETTRALTPGISDEQAKAFGTAFAASIFYEGAMRRNMPMFDINPFDQNPSIFWSHLPESLSAGFEYATMHWPLVKDVWPFIEASWKFCGQWISHMLDNTKPAPNFDTILNEVRQNIATRQQGDTSWQGLTESHLREGDRAAAGSRVASAGNIAGVDVTERAQIAANGGAMVSQDGVARTVTTAPGGDVTIETPVGTNGQPITRLDRVATAAGGVLGRVPEIILDPNAPLAQKVGVGVGALGVGLAATKIVPPVLRAGAAAVAGVTSVTTESAIAVAGGSGLAAQTLQGREAALAVERATAEAALTRAQEAQAAARGSWNPLQRFKLWNDTRQAQSALNAVTREAETVGKAITTFGPEAAAGSRGVALAENAAGNARAASGAVDRVLQGLRILPQNTTLVEAAPRVFGAARWLTQKVPYLGGLLSGAETAGSVASNDVSGAAIRGTETAGIVWSIARLGAGRAFMPVMAAMSVGDLANSAAHGDGRGVTRASTTLGGLAAGAGIGFCVGGPPGAVVGAGVAGAIDFTGTVAGWLTGGSVNWSSQAIGDRIYDHFNPQAAAPRPQAPAAQQRDGAAGAADPGLAAAATQRAQEAAAGPDARRAAGTIDRSQTAAAAMTQGALPGLRGHMLNFG